MRLAYGDTAKYWPKQRIEHRDEPAAMGWSGVGACACFGGGLLAGLFGSVMTAISWLEGAGSFRAVGTALLLLMIPLLVVGAHCFDLAEKRVKGGRESHLDEHE